MTNDNDTTFQDLSCAYREIDRLKAELNDAHAQFPPTFMAGLALGDKVRQMKTLWERATVKAGEEALKVGKLKAENQTLRNAQKACESCDAPTLEETNRLKAENAKLAAALSQARLQTLSLREAGHAAMRTDYAAEAVGDVNEGDATAFYLEGFEAAVKEIRKVDVSTALRDLLEPAVNTLDRIDRYQAGAGMIPSRKEVNDLIARLRAAMGDEKE